jgi:hypothetical protein
MKRIGPYLNTTVTIIQVTLSEGDRTEVTISNVPAALFNVETFVKTTTGGFMVNKSFVGLESDVVITGQDEILIDGVKYPVVGITPVRESRYSSAISHIEVELG